MSYSVRRLLTAGLVANAIRPPQAFRLGIPAFVLGWPTGELAPQLLGLTALDTAVAAARGRVTPVGLAAAALSAGGLVHLARQGARSAEVLDRALADGLGESPGGGREGRPDGEGEGLPLAATTPWRRLARPFRFAEAGVRVQRDLVYDREHGRRGRLDLYRPDREDLSGAPVLLQVHGGGWTLGSKEQQAQPLLHRMASRGWVCVAINYRLAPRSPFPAAVVDVNRAIAWIKEHIAEHGGDPGYLAITGGSAGGHLAALAALTAGDPDYRPGFASADTSVQAAVPFYGVYDLAGASGLRSAEQMRDLFLAGRILQVPFARDRAAFEAGSPLLRITPDAPDFFVLHGDADSLVDVGQARAFVSRLREVSRSRVVYAELPGAQHAFDTFHSLRSGYAVDAVDRFLTWSHRRYLEGAGSSGRP